VTIKYKDRTTVSDTSKFGLAQLLYYKLINYKLITLSTLITGD